MDILEKKEGQTYVEAFIGKIKVLSSENRIANMDGRKSELRDDWQLVL